MSRLPTGIRPATRVDNWIIWPGGYSRQMTILERLQWRFRGRRYFPKVVGATGRRVH